MEDVSLTMESKKHFTYVESILRYIEKYSPVYEKKYLEKYAPIYEIRKCYFYNSYPSEEVVRQAAAFSEEQTSYRDEIIIFMSISIDFMKDLMVFFHKEFYDGEKYE